MKFTSNIFLNLKFLLTQFKTAKVVKFKTWFN